MYYSRLHYPPTLILKNFLNNTYRYIVCAYISIFIYAIFSALLSINTHSYELFERYLYIHCVYIYKYIYICNFIGFTIHQHSFLSTFWLTPAWIVYMYVCCIYHISRSTYVYVYIYMYICTCVLYIYAYTYI